MQVKRRLAYQDRHSCKRQKSKGRINNHLITGFSITSKFLIKSRRVDFLVGAKDFLKFGFALNSGSEGSGTFASFQVFDSSNNLLASSTKITCNLTG